MPTFWQFCWKTFDHIYKTQKYSESGSFCEKLKKQRKIVNRLANNLIFIHFCIKMLKNLAKSFFLQWDFFFGMEEVFFLVWLAPFGCLYYFHFFCHLVVRFIHLVFRQTRELYSSPRTMAQTVSPRRSLLDQGASLINISFFWLAIRLLWWKSALKCN